MKCPECIKADKKSRVTQGATMTQALHVPMQWDEEGQLIAPTKHAKSTTAYSCSEGHTWTEVE